MSVQELYVYMAGRARVEDYWRCGVLSRFTPVSVTDPHGEVLPAAGDGDLCYARGADHALPVLEDKVYGQHAFVGRWPLIRFEEGFVYCGLYYENTPRGEAGRPARGSPAEAGVFEEDPPETASRRVRCLCAAALEEADCVFAFIDSENAFGAFAELGMARTLGKDVRAAFSGEAWMMGLPEDLWLVLDEASVDREYTRAEEAFDDLLRRYGGAPRAP